MSDTETGVEEAASDEVEVAEGPSDEAEAELGDGAEVGDQADLGDEVEHNDEPWHADDGLEGSDESGLEEGDEDDGESYEDEDEDEDYEDAPAAMSRMLFVDIVLVLPSTHPVIVLQEAELPYRELRIPIGGPEGIAIGYAARRIPTPRPLSHVLMTRLLESFDLSLDVVRITDVERGSFTAEIHVSGPSGARTIDCRPSDAIALALLQKMVVPIMVSPDVLDAAGSGAAGSN